MSSTITALQIQKKNKDRVNVFLDGEFAFGLTLMAAAQLKKGQVLSAAEIEMLRQDDERHVAYQRAIHLLGFRPRSEAEVRQHLRDKGFAGEVIDAVVTQLVQEEYLDDESFTRFWMENREQFRPRSARALRHELRQKGVERAVIDAAVATVDEDAAAWAAVEPKLARWSDLDQTEFGRKITGFLGRRGFSYEVVRRISRRAWAELGKSGELGTDE
ncbi:MAG: RecX family transcriptional regulator [Chloroflexi bacterium]|nr:MAG: RecX family transcriptional regulator [Chloroflexota bacterium]